jgi:hypothetical protein
VVLVVDLRQVGQLGRGQLAVRTQEADRFVAAVLDRSREPGLVTRLDRPDLDVRRC